MITLLLFLRTGVAVFSGLLIWVVVTQLVGGNASLPSLLIPVWCAGIGGGVLCTVFSPSQGVSLAAVSGVVMALGWLTLRHWVLQIPLEDDWLIALWPVWFIPAYYVGAYGYLRFLWSQHRR